MALFVILIFYFLVTFYKTFYIGDSLPLENNNKRKIWINELTLVYV